MAGASLRQRADAIQKRHRVLSFPYAVHKRYTEDRGKHYSALISYYGFFSLFPLLLSFVAVLGVVLRGRPGLRQDLIDSALGKFPVIGTQLADTTGKGIAGNGWALAFGLIAAVWAGLGVVYAAQDAMDTMWDVPQRQRPNFIWKRVWGIAMLGVVGAGIAAGAAVAAISTQLDGIADAARVAAALGTAVVNALFLLVAFHVLTVARPPMRNLVPGAIAGGIALFVLQLGGTWYVSQFLKDASDTYGTFATVIGLLTWLALQARVVLYAAEINVVLQGGLWPRSLTEEDPLDKPDVAPATK
jgi:YihY family inner membrane protein